MVPSTLTEKPGGRNPKAISQDRLTEACKRRKAIASVQVEITNK